ncbi:MAG: hypothetical protein JWR03_2978 [Cohnella sp.]|nr:hypothetical protein [Cohnella sp.]
MLAIIIIAVIILVVECIVFLIIDKIFFFKKIQSVFLRRLAARLSLFLLISLIINFVALFFGATELHPIGVFLGLCLLYMVFYVVVW